MISMREAVMQTITGKGRLFRKEYVPEAFLEYASAYNLAHKKHKIFKDIDSSKHYGLSKKELFTSVKFDDVRTDLISVHWKTLCSFYGGTPSFRYGQWARRNKERLTSLGDIYPIRAKELVKYASGDRWSLEMDGRSGFYIKQLHLDNDNMIDIINTNYEIAHALGRVAILNA